MLLKLTLLLAMMVFWLFGFVWYRQSGIFRECEAALLSLQWMLLACLAVWCGSFIFLTFRHKDVPLIALLLIAIAAFFISYAASRPAVDAIILLAGVTLGKGTQFLLQGGKRIANSGNLLNAECGTRSVGNESKLRTPNSELRTFLVGLVGLLAFGSWWHLDVAHQFYPRTRWTGLWDNPNTYGMLMGAGLTLAIGLLLQMRSVECGVRNEEKRKPVVSSQQSEVGSQKTLRSFAAIKSALRTPHSALLLVAVGMMGTGLVFSYSRGAWLGTAVGLLYLAKAHGKFKWRFVLPGIVTVAAVVFCFWHSTTDTGPWYLKRMDLSRASAQHRVAAWHGALQMMRDHPFGVGWNKAVETYDKQYSPPEGSAAAITTNDYLMLGTQLGFPGLLCFVAYVALCFRSPRSTVHSPQSLEIADDFSKAEMTLDSGLRTMDSTKVACRAGALAMLVAFWFDGGLFKLATAAVFWILLELGSFSNAEGRMKNAETDQSLVTSAATKILAEGIPEN